MLHFQDFVSSHLRFIVSSSSSFVFRISLGNLPKIQTGIYRDLLSPRRKYCVLHMFLFFILLLLFLYSTQKKVIVFVNAFYNIFSLSLGFKFSVCNFVSLSCLSRVCVLSHIIHNPGEEKEVFLQMMMCYHYQSCSHIDNFVACLSLSQAIKFRIRMDVCCW